MNHISCLSLWIRKIFIGTFLCIAIGNLAMAESKGQYGKLKTHEPIFIGYTWDQDDVGFMDFKLSVRYPLLHDAKPKSAALGFLPYPYLSFSGRFGQYIGTRASSPVISKRFNPELFGRYWLTDAQGFISKSSVDVIYGHESNGQNVTNEEGYIITAAELHLQGDDPKFADDYISRGWDYLGLRWNQHWSDSILTFTQIHHLLNDGLLQGEPENYNDWENDSEGKPREEVYGLSFAFKRDVDLDSDIFNHQKIFVKFTTGLEKTFSYNTVLMEMSFTMGNLPLMFWVSHGYNSDLADYFKEHTSGGIAVEFIN